MFACRPASLAPRPPRPALPACSRGVGGLLRVWGLLLLAAGPLAAQTPSASPIGTGILVDGIHANDLVTESLQPEVYNYHATCGSRRSFDYLQAQGVEVTRVTEGRLTPELLASRRLLFLNLVSAERPPFLVSEITAIREFVQAGGSLLVITDHSNCYYHTHVLGPLFAELDLASFTDTVCDVHPNTLDNGNAWLSITRFRTHPVTEGLRRLGIQTGGRVDPRFAVALSSEQAWADRWATDAFGHANAPGFYGNFRREADEASGPLGVALARDFGRGRIVVLGDQNMIGDTFLHYADNYRLWLNALAWLLDQPALRDAEAYCRWRQPRIVMYEPVGHPEFGCNEPSGLYYAYALVSRYWWTFASDRWVEPADLLVVGYNQDILPPEDVAAVVRHLRRGRNLLILNTESQLLWDELGLLSQVFQAMALEKSAPQVRDGKSVWELPGGGAIHLVGPDALLDNGLLAPPMQEPTEAQRQQEQRLLAAIRDALPPTTTPRPQ